jgi:hypothetical protein
MADVQTPHSTIDTAAPAMQDTALALSSPPNSSAPRTAAAWPMVALAPAAVIVIGLAIALAIGVFGVSDLSIASDAHASERAALIASTLAARLSRLPASERLEAMQRAARKTGAELVVASPDGDIARRKPRACRPSRPASASSRREPGRP